MLLNNSALNVVVLDGAGGTKYTQSMIASVTSSTATIVKAASKFLSAVSSTASTVTKSIGHLFSLITSGNTTSLTKRDNKAMTATGIVSSPSVIKNIAKTETTSIDYVVVVLTDIAKHLVGFSYSSVVTTSLNKAVNKYFLVSSSAITNMYLGYSRTLSYVSNTIISFTKTVTKNITTSIVNSIVTSVYNKFYYRFLTATTAASTSVSNTINKIQNIVSNSYIYFTKQVNKSIITNVVSNTFTILVNVIPKFGAVLKDTFFAITRKRTLKKVRVSEVTANQSPKQKL